MTERVFLTAASIAAVAATAIAQMTIQAAAQQPNLGGDQAQVDLGKADLGKADLGKADLGKVDLGKVTYAQKCSHCHGPNMVNAGTITPDLRAFPDDRTRFVTTVKQGKNGKMPPWGDVLSEQEIADIWAYISSRRTP